MKKSIDDYFHDWESETIGYGYGTGEDHTMQALKDFFGAVRDDGYDYEELEKACGGAVAWLLISILCKADIIEYGTSPRYAWLTEQGKAVREYINRHTEQELYDNSDRDSDYIECYSYHCNCNNGYDCTKLNPFWKPKK